MSRIAVRVGAPTSPTVTTAGTPGVSDEVRTFTGYAARPCVITNMHETDHLYILVNEEAASDVNFLCKLSPGQAVEISIGSQIAIGSVSLYYAVAAYSNALVKGWLA